MRFTRIALAAMLVSLAGCSVPDGATSTTSTGTGGIGGGQIETVEHGGHLFTVWDGAYAGGIIHSPSCPCQQHTEAPE